MKIILHQFSTNYNLLPIKNVKQAREYGIMFANDGRSFSDAYIVYWGNKMYDMYAPPRYGVMEGGFFCTAAFIDTIGGFQNCSLNTKSGYDAVANFELNGRKSAKEIVFGMPPTYRSKYNPYTTQRLDVKEWKGVVLILQKSTDRSVISSTSRQGYYDFVNDACKFYGKDLFVKFHPYNAGYDYEMLKKIIDSHGVRSGKVAIDFVRNAEFCIGYNSQFVIDTILRDMKYVQYAMGTFFNAYGVNYSNYTFPTSVERIADSHKLPDFLIHKYCWNRLMTPEKFVRMLHVYANSKEMFPLTEEFSYANNLPV